MRKFDQSLLYYPLTEKELRQELERLKRLGLDTSILATNCGKVRVE